MSSIYYLRQFSPNTYYHIYNRGAHRQNIFHDSQDYETFTQILSYYLTHPLGTAKSILNRAPSNKVPYLVKSSEKLAYTLLAYCLMPNHFHFMLRQDSETITISNLMKRLSITYAMYYNSRYHHSGAIFQGKYKNVPLETESQWLYLSKYIHQNPRSLQGSVPCKLSAHSYSSYLNYLGKRTENWLDTSPILSQFSNNPTKEYQRFIEDEDDLGNIERLTLDDENI